MKKIGLLALFIGFSNLILAQHIEKDVGDFSEVRVSDRITVSLTPDTKNRIEINGKNAENVVITNKQGSLRIRMETAKFMGGDQIEATLYYKDIKELTAANGGMITSDHTLETPALKLNANKGGEIELNLQTKRLEAKATSGARVELSGNSDYLRASINSGGDIDARDLKVKNAELSVSTGGEMEVNVSDTAEAKINLGGTIYIYGHPQITEKITAGGTIHRMD